ncbi:MAG: signal peptidase II [Spirochaetaceae bacterium]|nr:signal peptidase II [Spirochaetaceae bacterium]
MSPPSARERYLPLLLTLAVVAADQIVKAIVEATLPLERPVPVIGDFLRFTYVHNTAIAFSIGRGIPADLRRVLLLILPLVAIGLISAYYFATDQLTRGQRWLLAAIMGGGIGNYVDRVARPDGVVDFVDVKFYGILGFSRFPTFNVADSSVVVAGILLLASSWLVSRPRHDAMDPENGVREQCVPENGVPENDEEDR